MTCADFSGHLTDIVAKAKEFAIAAHAETNHRYAEHPYDFHLEKVAGLAWIYRRLLDTVEEAHLAAAGAWVHDVIEDARMTYNDVLKATNKDVAEIAYALTNEKGRNRKERANDKYYAGIRANKVAHFLKICDRIANVMFSLQTGSTMLDKYRAEYREFRQQLWCERYKGMFTDLEKILKVEP